MKQFKFNELYDEIGAAYRQIDAYMLRIKELEDKNTDLEIQLRDALATLEEYKG